MPVALLSDRTIRRMMECEKILISPFQDARLGPCSYDVSLGPDFLVFDDTKGFVLDPEADNSLLMRKVMATRADPFILHPGQFALGATAEEVGVNEEYVCLLNGKSSLGRLGLMIHVTAGFIDPGNSLKITLELKNEATMPIILRPGMLIAQVVFEELTEPCERPYRGKYLRAQGVEASKMHLNYVD